jgi:hypothetical protein
MIFNIIDNRKRRYRWKKINAIVEATAHDNSCADSDQQPDGPDDVTYEQVEGVSLQDAVAWADAFDSPVTLYIYDDGEGTMPL